MDGTVATDFYQLGLGHLKHGDLRAAYEEFREATRMDPTNFEIWQMYEETYRKVEKDIEAQHLTRRPVESLAGRRENGTALPHFTLKVSRSTSSFADDGEDVDEAHARAVFLRGGSLFAHYVPEVQPAVDNLEMVAGNPKIYFCMLLSWLLTFLMVIYHYRARIHHRGMHAGEKCGWVALALAALIYVVRRHQQQHFRLRASDVIKVLCLLVIFVCTLYHISRYGKTS
ncbi:unnamed protein product [Effrenium voratum]|uniref:Uncharacterized protein n=1 Tax=Effrenium voratum TaxID=2562239 RepID=A0AA36NH37_9DINO|nr:unnamed protein product [Effrenium voratum]CAJ1406882.1 unnamed protein product [Effrenium voratum]